jgi:ureidoglycolate lyase
VAGIEFLMRRISCEALDAAAFSLFGVVIDPAGKAPELINDGSTRRYTDLARLDLCGDVDDGSPMLHIYEASARAFPLMLARLERHRRASQVFMPLGGQRFIVVVAPGGNLPEWDQVRAFLTAPGQGISLHRGCWHHGLIALNDGDRFAVIEGGGYRSDTEEVGAPGELLLEGPVEKAGTTGQSTKAP